eukprot:1296052-Pleurochrysis_carterae.AAC.3
MAIAYALRSFQDPCTIRYCLHAADEQSPLRGSVPRPQPADSPGASKTHNRQSDTKDYGLP